MDAFERLGARLDAERVQERLGRLEARRTFLFTDIVDSTKLLDTLGDDKWKRSWRATTSSSACASPSREARS